MICKNCSFDNQPEETVCKKCGSSLTEEAVSDEIGTEESIQVADEVQDQDETGASSENENSSAEVDETAEFKANVEEIDSADIVPTTIDKEEATIKSSKRAIVAAFSGLIVLVILGISLFILYSGIFAPKYDIPNDRIKNSVAYVKEDMLYLKPLTGKIQAISGPLTAGEDKEGVTYQATSMLQSEDGKTTYFLEEMDRQANTGTLYVAYNNKDKKQIATGVSPSFVISKDGKSVMYLQNLDAQTSFGQLFIYKKGGEPKQLAQATATGFFMFSDNSKAMAYIDNLNQETYAGDLYFSDLSGNAIQVDSNVVAPAKMSSKNEITYFRDYQPDLSTVNFCYWKKGKEKIIAAEGVNPGHILTTPLSTDFAFVKMNESKYDLYLKETSSNKESEIMKDIMGFFSYDVENKNFLLAKTSEESPESPDMYLKKGSSQPVHVASQMASQRHGSASLDYNTITYITNVDQSTGAGTLYQKKFLFGKLTSEKEIAQNVSNFVTTRDGKTVAYMADMQEDQSAALYIYKNGKVVHITDGIFQGNFKLDNKGKSIIYLANFNNTTYSGDLFVKNLTGSGKMTQIDNNVYAMFYSRSDKNAIYFKDFSMETNSGNLFLWKGSKTPEQVDSNVSAIMFETK